MDVEDRDRKASTSVLISFLFFIVKLRIVILLSSQQAVANVDKFYNTSVLISYFLA